MLSEIILFKMIDLLMNYSNKNNILLGLVMEK